MQVTNIACPFSKFVSLFHDCCFVCAVTVLEVLISTVPFNGNVCEFWYSHYSDCEDTIFCDVTLCRLVAGFVSEEPSASIFRTQDCNKRTEVNYINFHTPVFCMWFLLLKSKYLTYIIFCEEMISVIYIPFFSHFLCDLNSLFRHINAFRPLNWSTHYTFVVVGQGDI